MYVYIYVYVYICITHTHMGAICATYVKYTLRIVLCVPHVSFSAYIMTSFVCRPFLFVYTTDLCLCTPRTVMHTHHL